MVGFMGLLKLGTGKEDEIVVCQDAADAIVAASSRVARHRVQAK